MAKGPVLRRRQGGFSLVELLLVIAIIAVLIGLLLPAVQKVRQAAYQAQSANNIKQMALASHAFENTMGYMPPTLYTVYTSNDTGVHTIGESFQYSFCHAILAYIEQGALASQMWKSGTNPDGTTYTSYNYGNLPPNVPVKTYANPSDPSGDGSGIGPNGGGTNVTQHATVAYSCNADALTVVENITMLINPSLSQSAATYMNLASSYPDGTSNTILLAECYSNFQVKLGTITSHTPNLLAASSPYFRSTTTVQNCPTLTAAIKADLQSVRPSGLLVGLVDGSVRPVPPSVFSGYNIPNSTWRNACIPNDGNELGTDW